MEAHMSSLSIRSEVAIKVAKRGKMEHYIPIFENKIFFVQLFGWSDGAAPFFIG
jgi:hypothetical protein